MKVISVFLLLLTNSLVLFSQEKTNSNKLGFSIPIIWNNSNAVFYSLGSRKEPNGNAISFGTNINYSHFFYKNLYIIGGIGYYKQKFGIQRPFKYIAPDLTRPGVYTKSYYYQNIHFLLGVGYQKMITSKWLVGGQLSYNMYRTFKQRYKQEYFPGKNEVYKNIFMIGNMINLDIKCERYLNSRLSIGGAIVLPLYTHWNDDTIFVKYDFADDTQKIAESKFSIGANLSLYYQLKK